MLNSSTKQTEHVSLNIGCIALLVLAFLVFIPSTRVCDSSEQQIRVVLRYDDYSSVSSTNLELRLVDILRKYDLPCTFGVVPYAVAGDFHDVSPQSVLPLSDEKAEILKKASRDGVLEVALHGYSHQTTRKGSDGGYSEFSGLDIKTQIWRIAQGKKLLEDLTGTQITTFIPPWNKYDFNTLRVLDSLGFKVLSAGRKGVTNKSSQLRVLPGTCGITEVGNVVTAARESSEPEPVIVVLFHEFDFIEIDQERGRLEWSDFIDLVSWLTSQKDIRLSTLRETAEELEDLDSNRFWKYSFANSSLGGLLPPLLRSDDPHFYPSSEILSGLIVKRFLLLALFYSLGVFVSAVGAFLIGHLLFSQKLGLICIARYGGLAILMFLFVYSLYDLDVGRMGATVLACALGSVIGVWRSSYGLHRAK